MRIPVGISVGTSIRCFLRRHPLSVVYFAVCMIIWAIALGTK